MQVTAPFSKEYGPEEFTASADFIKKAFDMTPDDPLAGPIVGQDAIYVIALAKKLPSEIPPLSQIRARVTRDYQFHEATLKAQSAGTNFVVKLQIGLALEKSFPAICTASGLHAVTLPPFSLSTPDLSELGERAPWNQLKAVTFGTEIGRASDFEPTDDGGFIVYVQSQLPLDVAAMNANLPRFAATLRQQRETAAFYTWLNYAANRDLRATPLFSEQSGNAAQ